MKQVGVSRRGLVELVLPEVKQVGLSKRGLVLPKVIHLG